MGCNCGQNKNAVQKWVYIDSTGKEWTYTSEIQAQAAKIRDKGLGIVKKI